MAQQENGVQDKPMNPLYLDICNIRKLRPIWKERQNESNTQVSKPTAVQQREALNINNEEELQARSTWSTNQFQEESLKQQIKQLQQEVEHL